MEMYVAKKKVNITVIFNVATIRNHPGAIEYSTLPTNFHHPHNSLRVRSHLEGYYHSLHVNLPYDSRKVSVRPALHP